MLAKNTLGLLICKLPLDGCLLFLSALQWAKTLNISVLHVFYKLCTDWYYT